MNQYTVCYQSQCMHNSRNRCKKAIPIGECERRAKTLGPWER